MLQLPLIQRAATRMLLAGMMLAGLCSAGNIFVAQAATGTGAGTDCANAHPMTWFNSAGNWGSGSAQIGPGGTVHICGTFTGGAGATGLIVAGSGTAAQPITILFEPGA